MDKKQVVEVQNQASMKTGKKEIAVRSGKECAYLAIFVALVIVAQLVFAAVPGVEVVTVLFLSYAFVFGVRRGTIAATAFALLRQLIFGFSPTVLILYLVYFNGLAALLGTLGRVVKKPLYALWWIVLVACVCTACFTMMDNILTPLWYGFSKRAIKAYITASLPFMIPQIICTALSVGFLFLPLQKTFYLIGKNLFKMRKQQKKEG
jgi:energy-coupling factor transport system substrate-specific component/cob(I)alamin adenosyltransferase